MALLRVLFMGSDAFSLPVLQGLVENGSTLRRPVEVPVVVTQPDRPAGRGRSLRDNTVKRYAVNAGIEVLQPERVRDPAAVDTLLQHKADLIVVASFGQILPRRLIEVPRLRALNLHPSLLPRHRGPTPINSAILDGDEFTGTTLMLMSSKMDAGPILAQNVTEIGRRETAGELTERLAQMSAGLLLRRLPDWADGNIVPRPQDEGDATYTRLLRKDDARLDWTLTAETLSRQVRAFNPWPMAFTFWDGRPMRILSALPAAGHAAPGNVLGMMADGLAVGTGAGLLLVEIVQLAGGRPMPAGAMLAGHPSLVHATLD